MAKVDWHHKVELDLGFGNARKIVARVGRDTKSLAKATAPKDTGSLSRSIDFWQISAYPKSLGNIGVLNSSLNRGAGWRYGKGSSPIRPTNADVLVMHHKGINLIVARGGVSHLGKRRTPMLRFRGKAGHVVQTQYTTGYPANPFLVNAFKKSCPYPVVEFPV